MRFRMSTFDADIDLVSDTSDLLVTCYNSVNLVICLQKLSLLMSLLIGPIVLSTKFRTWFCSAASYDAVITLWRTSQ